LALCRFSSIQHHCVTFNGCTLKCTNNPDNLAMGNQSSDNRDLDVLDNQDLDNLGSDNQDSDNQDLDNQDSDNQDLDNRGLDNRGLDNPDNQDLDKEDNPDSQDLDKEDNLDSQDSDNRNGAPPPPQAYQAQDYHTQQQSSFQESWYSAYTAGLDQQRLETLRNWFNKLDKVHAGVVTANELAQVQFGGKPLGLDAATKFIKVFDRDHSLNVDFNEYTALHAMLEKLSTAFYQADTAKSGTLDSRQLLNTLSTCGFGNLNLVTIENFVKKYAGPTATSVNFEQYLHLCAHLALVRSIFEHFDTDKDGKVTFTLDQLAFATIDLAP